MPIAVPCYVRRTVASGAFGGGQLGFNSQRGSYRVRRRSRHSRAAASVPTATVTVTGPAETANYKSKLDWFGTVRGRLGYTVDRALIYATGGVAFGGIDNEVSFGGAGVGTYKKSDTASGYVVGGGVEYKLTPSWSAKAEYQYINLGKNDPVNAAGVGFSTFNGTKVDEDAFHTVRLGLNYHVGTAYAPLK